MKQDQEPIDHVSLAVVPEPAHHKPRRHAASTTRGLRKPELKLTSMIDVVFLLLIFFVVTASFQIDEGSLLANLPGNSKIIDPNRLPPTPVQVDMLTSDDGLTYAMQVNGVTITGASELSAYMANRVRTGQMASDDLVQIKPQGEVRWQHVVNTYNACVTAKLEQVSFAY